MTAEEDEPGRLTVAVASGKGGTGKTLVATNLSVLVARRGGEVALVDCDVDAPNAALFLPLPGVRSEPVTVPLPEVDASGCVLCGACRDVCAYGALRVLGGTVVVFPELCHGCGACVAVCAPRAIVERGRRVGQVEVGRVDSEAAAPGKLDVITGRLDVGEVKTPAVIRAARARAVACRTDVVVLDAPPGVACATVAALRGADIVVLVTEPTPFGVHDLGLALELAHGLGVPAGIVINREGAGATDIAAYCEAACVPVLARIPFDRRVASIYAQGRLVLDAHPDAPGWFGGLWDAVRQLAAKGGR